MMIQQMSLHLINLKLNSEKYTKKGKKINRKDQKEWNLIKYHENAKS
jgi:hypothetical protein